MRLEDKTYLMRLGEQSYVDAREHTDVLARYINDCGNSFFHNDKRPDEGFALVVTKRRINAGEEVYLDYGPFYWAGVGIKKCRLSPILANSVLKGMDDDNATRDDSVEISSPSPTVGSALQGEGSTVL